MKKEEKELLESASYWLSTAVDIFNGSSGLNTDPKVDKYMRMVECKDKIQDYLNSHPKPSQPTGETVFRKVSVKERLPANMGYYAVWCDYEKTFLHLKFEVGKFTSIYSNELTYWLEEIPLPQSNSINKEEIIKWIDAEKMEWESTNFVIQTLNRVRDYIESLPSPLPSPPPAQKQADSVGFGKYLVEKYYAGMIEGTTIKKRPDVILEVYQDYKAFGLQLSSPAQREEGEAVCGNPKHDGEVKWIGKCTHCGGENYL